MGISHFTEFLLGKEIYNYYLMICFKIHIWTSQHWCPSKNNMHNALSYADK